MANKKSDLSWRLFVYTRKELLFAIGIFFGAFLMVVLAILPQINTIQTTNAKLAKEKTELDKYTSKYKELEQIKLSPEFGQSEKIDSILPSKKPLLELMSAINAVAASSQVAITELKISPGEIATTSAQLKQAYRQNPAAYDEIELSLKVYGQLNNIQQFMVMIEQISPITTITKITLNQSTNQQSGVVITTAQLSLQTNYFTQQIKTSLTAGLPKISNREKEIFATIQGFTIPEPEEQTEVTGGGQADPFAVEKLPTN